MQPNSRKKRSVEPDGQALAKTQEPLAEAAKWVDVLVSAHAQSDTLNSTITLRDRMAVCFAQVEVCLLQRKIGNAHAALNRARKAIINSQKGTRKGIYVGEIHLWHVRLLSAVAAAPEALRKIVQVALKDVENFNAKEVATAFLDTQIQTKDVDYNLVVAAARVCVYIHLYKLLCCNNFAHTTNTS